MSAHSIYFYGELTKNILQLSSKNLLTSSSETQIKKNILDLIDLESLHLSSKFISQCHSHTFIIGRTRAGISELKWQSIIGPVIVIVNRLVITDDIFIILNFLAYYLSINLTFFYT